MSKVSARTGGTKARRASSPPFVGALLRLSWQRVRRHINAAVRAGGFDDLQDAHLMVFQYPAPDAVRPAALARRLGMSRQAANYLIAQLEALGYLERRAAPESGRRLVHLTARGWRVVETIYASLRQFEDEWAAEVGRKRFADFMEVLRLLSAEERAAERN